MHRRNLLLGAAGWVVAASVHSQADKPRRIGVLFGWTEADPESRLRLSILRETLASAGWVDGRSVVLDVRWGDGDAAKSARLAKELVALKPDAILSTTTPATVALHHQTRTVPIVFAVVSDPVGSKLVNSLARPGGNVTGFTNIDSSLILKWLQLLKEIAPRMKRAGVMFNPRTAPFADYYLRPLTADAAKLGVETFNLAVNSVEEIDRAVAKLGREPQTGLVAMVDSFLYVHRKALTGFCLRSRLPAVYFNASIADDGGLIAYGIDNIDLIRRGAAYVDRILRGAKPAELPVEAPAKFELAVNVKTARALGLTVPTSILVQADRVIQ